MPYWRPGGRVSCESDAIKVSCYEKPDALMLVVVNTTDETIEDALSLDTRSLSLGAAPAASIYDPVTRLSQRATWRRGERLAIKVEPYMMLLIEVSSDASQ